jgi:hypothetical protein
MPPQHLTVPVLALLLVALLLPAVSRAQQVTLELEPGDTTLSVCDMAHKTSCDMVHITAVSAVEIGAIVELDNQPYVLDWLGPGYHLDSGVILEPVGETRASLAGQRWVEVYPEEGRIHVSKKWQDRDASRRLSVSDTLTLEDGRAVRILDVRLHVRVTPAKPE